MAAQNDHDEDDKKQSQQQTNPLYQSDPQHPQMLKTLPADGGMGGGTNKPISYPFQRTFQAPQQGAGTQTPGQQTAMPWSQLAPNMANFGRSATPWAQTMQAPQMPMQGQQAAAPGGMPNWQALMQRFGGGNTQAPSPVFQMPRFQAPWMQGMQGGQGFQLPPWLAQAAQAIAARGGGGFAMPGLGAAQQGGQGLPIFNVPRNTY